MLKGWLFLKGLVESWSTVAVHSLGTHYYHTTLFHRSLCRRHSLYRLIYVPVHGVAPVGGYNYVGRNGINLTLLDKEVGPYLVGGSAVTCHGKHRLVGCVYYHIDYEGQPGVLCGIKHVPVNRIVYKKAGAGMVRGYEPVVVIIGDRLPAGYARQNTFAPAGEACEEVRLYKAFGHQQVCLYSQPVKHKTPTRGELSYIDQVGSIVAVVHHYLLFSYYIASKFLLQLLPGGGPVQAGGYKDCYVGIWVLKPYLLKDLRHYDPAWHGPGMV